MANENVKVTMDFVLAGRAVFTAWNDLTGGRYTFMVKQSNGIHLVKVLIGNNNDDESSYFYIGIIVPDRNNKGKYVYLKGKNISPNLKTHEIITFILNVVQNDLQTPNCFHLEHCGKCGKCGKTLTTPESISLGIGPKCAAKMGI